VSEVGKRNSLFILVILVTLLTAFVLPAKPVKANPGWYKETVDSGTSVDEHSCSLALYTGYPHISYYNRTNGDLKYASYNGTAWNIQTVDSAGDVGRYASLALDATNHNPRISYWDGTNGDLKYASYNGTDWNLETVDSAGKVGAGTSLALDSNGYPHISHYDSFPNYDLKYASYNGTDWNLETVDSAGNVGYFNSLALDSTTGYPRISYWDGTNGDLKYASYNGTAWNLETVDSAGNVGAGTSLALDSNGYPHIGYYDSFPNYDLKYASWNGATWNLETVDSAGDVGRYTSLALDATNHNPRISYYDYTNQHLKYASYNGTAWNIQTVDSAGNVGTGTSLALDSNGYPHISYYDSTNNNLKYAFFIPEPGLAVSKGGSSVSKLGDNITYWVNISNTGDVSLQKVSVTDSLVAGIDGLFSATLSVGASENRTYTYTVQAGDEPGPIINTVTAVYSATGFPDQSESDSHSATLVHPSISVAKGGPAISKVGDTIAYWAAVANTGDCTLVKDSVSDNVVAGINGLFANTLAPGVTDNQTYTYVVQPGDPDPLVNTVTFHYHPQGLSNDITDNATCTVDLRHPDILITKGVAAGIYRAGDSITYLVIIDNTSTDITLVKDNVTDSLAGDITSLFSDNITAGGSEQHIYTYTVKSTDPDPLMNDVTAHYHPEGLPNDITDSTYANVFLAPTITSVTPNQGNQGQTLGIVITGSQLNRVNAVDFGAGITVNSITVDGPTQITVNISISTNAALGSRDVTVTNPTGTDTLTGGFTVQQSQTVMPSGTAGRRVSPSASTPPGMSGQSQIQLQYLSVRPQQTYAGQPVTVTTNVVNTGYEAGSYNVILTINGQVEESRMVSVGPQGTQPVQFTITKAQPGTYTVNIGDQKSSFVVTGAGSRPSAGIGESILFVTATAVIAILVVLLIIVARKRFQSH
jgi:uncharacterized repeat protein (TIGR01451 family)